MECGKASRDVRVTLRPLQQKQLDDYCQAVDDGEDTITLRLQLLQIELQELKFQKSLELRTKRVLPEAVTNLLPSRDSVQKPPPFVGPVSRILKKFASKSPFIRVDRNAQTGLKTVSFKTNTEDGGKSDIPELKLETDDDPDSSLSHIKIEAADDTTLPATENYLQRGRRGSRKRRSKQQLPGSDDEDWMPGGFDPNSTGSIKRARKRADADLQITMNGDIDDDVGEDVDLIKEEPHHHLDEWNDFEYDTSFLDYDLSSDLFTDPLASVTTSLKQAKSSKGKKSAKNCKNKKKPIQPLCDMCSYRADNLDSLDDHKERKHCRKEDLELVKCEHCEDEVERRRLETHTFAKHKDVKTHICDQCPFKTNCLQNLTKHINNMHLGINTFKCPECPLHCGNIHALKKHVNRIHRNIQNFMCELCSYRTATGSELKAHIENKHMNVGKFKCDKCEFSTSAARNLEKHKIRVHMHIKKFSCPMQGCGYCATEKGDIDKHVKRVHLGMRRYHCHLPQCEYKIDSKGKYLEHLSQEHRLSQDEIDDVCYKRKRTRIGAASRKSIPGAASITPMTLFPDSSPLVLPPPIPLPVPASGSST